MSSQTFNQLSSQFDQAWNELVKVSSQYSKKSLLRVMKKAAAHPLREEQVALINIHGEVELYELLIDIQALKLSLMIERLRIDAENDQLIAEGKPMIGETSEVQKPPQS